MSRHCTHCNLSVQIGVQTEPVCFGNTPHNLVNDEPPPAPAPGLDYVPTLRRVCNFDVDFIPDVFLDTFAKNGSVHASSVLNGSQHERNYLSQWIRTNIVSPEAFVLDHDHSIPLNISNNFDDYRIHFVERDFVVWNVGNDNEMTCRVNFVQRNDNTRLFELSGRPDYIITARARTNGILLTKADRFNYALCIIEVQSKHRDRDIPSCEVQLQLYIMLAMNVYGLRAVVGFLVQDNGMCRTYKASRNPESIMYEQNDLVHVSKIADVFLHLKEDLGI